MPEPGNPLAWDRYAYVQNNPVRYSDPSGHFSQEEIIHFFSVENWKEVLAYFKKGGQLEGRWGWFEVLKIAEYGDEITINWDKSLLTDMHADVSEKFLGKFDYNLDGSLIITGEDFFIDQIKAAKYGDKYELIHYEEDKGKVLGGAILIIATALAIGLPSLAAIPLSDFNPLIIKAVESLETFVVLPINIFGINLIREGIEGETSIYEIPAIPE